MTMPSRGISPIQEKARGKGMKKDMRKSMAPKPAKSSMKIKAKMPLDSMSVGAAMAPQDAAAGLRTGMKKGGSCGAKKMACSGAMKGYYKGGSVDGIVKKGRTRGKVC